MKNGNVSDRTPLKNRLGQFSVRTKLIIMLLVVSFCSMIASTYICSRASQEILSEKVFNQLTTLRGTTFEEIDGYFKFLINHTKTLSSDDMVVSAMKEYKSAFDKLATVNVPKAYDEKLDQFYRQEFVTRLKKTMDAVPLPETFVPKTAAARYIQYHYIANNPYPVGEKYKLSDPKDGSEYSRVNVKYNDKFGNIANRFGYHDLYLIDAQGNVVYSLANNVDTGINLLQGPAADSNFVEVFRDCRRSNSKEYVKVVDFQPYILSYNEPAAFVASPIFDGVQMIGVLAFKLPTDQINNIINHGNKWRENGLGETGEVTLVGPDLLLRSDTRFLIEDPDKFAQTLGDNGLPKSTINKIREFKTTILLLPTKSEGVKLALQGKTSAFRNRDYRGIEVLGAYTPIEFSGLRWSIAAKMDVTEAFASISKFERNVIVAAALIMVLTTLVAMWISRIFVKPIERLIATTQRVEASEDAMVVAGTRDEFQDLAREFNNTVYTLRSQIREREQGAAENEALIKQLLPLQIAKRLKAGEGVIADSVPNVTVMFTDLHRFTRLSDVMNSIEIVFLLDELVDAFDDLIDKYGLEKLKTLGDGYMAVCGLSMPYLDSDKRAIDCAMEMIAHVRRFNNERGLNLDLRVGINTGEVIAGTVGKTRCFYDVWGETVNIAYRLKSASPPGGILVSANIHERLIDLYEFEPFRPIAEPDKEALEVWLLRSERSSIEDKKELRPSDADTVTKAQQTDVRRVAQLRQNETPELRNRTKPESGNGVKLESKDESPNIASKEPGHTPIESRLPHGKNDIVNGTAKSIWNQIWKR
jgi:class 3 adenylate cyclase